MVEFTDEEGYGRYLDLHDCFLKFTNLKGADVSRPSSTLCLLSAADRRQSVLTYPLSLSPPPEDRVHHLPLLLRPAV